MELRPLMAEASAAAVAAVLGVRPEQFAGPTPCPDFDVRALANHLILWTAQRGRLAGLKVPIDGPTEGYDFVAAPDWAQNYAETSAATVLAWDDASAWEGQSSMSGNGKMPAPFVGGALFTEWMLHGWDLAAATGRPFKAGDQLCEALFEELAPMAEMAREYKVFGPEVKVPADAPPLARALGLAGRDPHWTP